MKGGHRVGLLCVAASLIVGLAPALALAEGPPMSALNPHAPAPQGFIGPTLEGPWRFRLAVNTWLTNVVEIGVQAGGASADGTEDLRWVLNHLKWLFPIDGEVRKGSFGIFAHSLSLKLAGQIETRLARVEWNDTMALNDVGLSYELGRWALGDAPRAPELTVEPFAAARLIYQPAEVTLTRLGVSATKDLSTYVPIVGLRLFWDLTEHWNLRFEGDYGGFGVDDNHQTWQAVGLLGYRFPLLGVHWNTQVGYRAMRLFDLRRGADITLDMRGANIVFSAEF